MHLHCNPHKIILLISLLVVLTGCAQLKSKGEIMNPDQTTPMWTPDRLGNPNSIATMEDYWSGKARWQLDRIWTQANTGWEHGFTAGSRLVSVKGIWYLFHRKVYFTDKCPGTNWEKLGTVVRRSLDRGHTWSDPVDVVIPTPDTPWSCMGTDGDVYYNEQENTWHMLFQSLGDDHVWSGSHVVREGEDPMGEFVQTHPNPIVPRGLLWMRICDEDTDDCVEIPGSKYLVYDEGTYDIFQYDGEYYWVSFHGFDGIHGYRGIAKTKDFRIWTAGDPAQGVPGDTIIDLKDLLEWREDWNTEVSSQTSVTGPIGVGAGTIISENDYYYIMVEGSDLNLLCIAGQNWDWGIFRSRDLTSTHWEQYPAGNPIFYSSKAIERDGKPLPCNICYGQFFRDPVNGEIYFKVGRESVDPKYGGIYLYKLVPSTNILTNGDLWMADDTGWNLLQAGASNINVYRYPNRSSDGNNYLELACKSTDQPCTEAHGFYQDVNVAGLKGYAFQYGGKFAVDGQDNRGKVVLQQADQDGTIIHEDSIEFDIGQDYNLFSGKGQILANTTYLRYIFSTQTNLPIRADEMFVDIIP